MKIDTHSDSLLENACEDAPGALHTHPPIPGLPPVFAYRAISFTSRFALTSPSTIAKSHSCPSGHLLLCLPRQKPGSTRPVDAAEGAESPSRTMPHQPRSQNNGRSESGKAFPHPLGKRSRSFGEHPANPNLIHVSPGGVFHKRPQAPLRCQKRSSLRRNKHKTIPLVEAVENASGPRAKHGASSVQTRSTEKSAFPTSLTTCLRTTSSHFSTSSQEKLAARSGMLW